MTIKASLSNIDMAIAQVQKYKNDLGTKMDKLISMLVDEGVKIARTQLVGINFTGELDASITGYYSPSTGVGVIKTDKWYAVYVEFGTGIVGKRSPHPDSDNWRYDINNHGDEGWIYFNERTGRWQWTKGFKSRPFMFNTARELEAKVVELAKEVFK